MCAKYRPLIVLCAITIFALPTLLAAQSTSPPTNTGQLSRVKVGGEVQDAQIVKKVQPEYPDKARQRHVEGKVSLHAIIGTDGAVKELTVISGPKELTRSALDAVKQWRYWQTLLNGKPVEVDTTITVEYRL